LDIVKRLRRECPWDRKQTHTSTKSLLIEECYEAIEAIDGGNAQDLKGELGDLLYLVFLNGVIAEETGAFGMKEVFAEAADKLVRRHPHVFGNAEAETAHEVQSRRERLKMQSEGGSSLLAGIPKRLPALLRAQKIQEKMSRAGFASTTDEEAWLLAEAALSSVQPGKEDGRPTTEEAEKRFGELVFALVSLSRSLDVNLEEASARTSDELTEKVASIEAALRTEGRTIPDANAEELAERWRRANRGEDLPA
jgi:MazG family protein